MDLAAPLWTPSPERVARATLTRYQQWLDLTHRHASDTYEQLWAWSVSDLEGFWSSICEFFDVRFSTAPTRMIASREMPGAQWCPGATVSYAEHIFVNKRGADVAIRHASELRPLAELSWDELSDQVARAAAGLRRCGVLTGDRVVAYLPNIPEAIVGLLACASIGAIWSSCSPDFGLRGVVDRFAQIEPKILLAVDGYRYGGRDFDRRDVLQSLMEQLPTLERTVVIPYLRSGAPAGTQSWAQLLSEHEPLSFAPLPFDHPLWVVYSSGTTGLPKPIVHSQGGILLEHLKKMHLHLDAQAGDRVFWFTTTGWMMWNFLVGVLLTPASIVLYDGNPGYPTMGRLWDLAEEAGISTFGTSAAFLAASQKDGIEPGAGRDLSALRALGSTGSPLAPEAYPWVYERLGQDTWLFSTSGGTDVCSAFVGGVPTLPVYQGELQARSLGCEVRAFDDEGHSVVGAVGELVLTAPMPSMPIYFWADADGRRYRESYFGRYPGVWRHGDWIEITERGGAIIYGRSDSTINRGGVRMGTSEIYRAVLSLPEIVDALVVDVPRAGSDGYMPLFVVLREGARCDAELVARIISRIRADCSPRHVPDEVRQIAEVPRTLSGKALEVPVKRVLMGTPVDQAASRDSLANPAALDWFADFRPVPRPTVATGEAPRAR